MAGDWIKMRTVLQTCPKVVRMASALDADRLRTVGGLHAAWCLFDAHSEDGRLSGYTADVLDDLIGWPGFSDAMESVDWLIIGDNFLELPRFDAHNGRSAKRRAMEADRKREARKSAEASACDADKKRTREEKRREDIHNTSESAIPRCPVQAIIDCYNQTVTKLPKVRVVPDAVKANIRSRWRDDHKFQSVDFWRSVFEYCDNHDFLSGRVERKDRPAWRASLSWIVKQANFAKIINEEYDR